MTARPSLLPVVIVALVGVALLKTAGLWIGFSGAAAQVDTAAPADDVSAQVPSAPSAPPSEAERRLLERLADRRDALEAREQAVETREALLEIAETRLEQRFAALAAEEQRIASLAAERRASEAEEYAALSNAYGRMKPREAARIFDEMEADLLVPVAAGMRTQALSGVLAEMNPDKARTLTRLLADHSRADAAAGR